MISTQTLEMDGKHRSPRHNEIKESLVDLILKQLDIEYPELLVLTILNFERRATACRPNAPNDQKLNS